MDPNANLARIRELLNNSGDSTSDDVEELEMLVRSMDEWLSRGGFLPAAWAR